jgi:serine/threonine-protein kinase
VPETPAPEKSPSFETVALDRGYITPVQLDECRGIRAKVAEAGLETSVEEVLLKKGYISRQQAQAINSVLGKGVRAAIEGYEILEKIAQGGMGAVFKAKQTSMDRLVAIKVLLPKFSKEKGAIERFLREAKAIAQLHHPNIVSGIDAGYANGIYYYVMEFLDGESMDRVMKRRGTLPWLEAFTIIRQVCLALDHAHKQGLVHRDIKPGNIILMRDGTAKLADLGLARMASGDDIYLTQTGVIVGTPAYISPEQARGEKVTDIRSDIYSLGITVFEFLSGRPPWQSDNALVVVTKHTTADVPVATLPVPERVAAIVGRMCHRDKRLRYPSPAELLEDLEAVIAGGSPKHAARPAAVHAPPPRRRPKPTVPLVAGAVVVVLALALAGLALGGGSPEPAKPPPGPALGTTPPGKLPSPPPDDLPAATEAERRAMQAYVRAKDFEQANPRLIEEAVDLYKAAVDAARGLPLEARAKKRLEELRTALADAIRQRGEEVERQARGAEEAGRYGEARDIAQRAESAFADAEWRRRMQERAKASVDRARAKFDGLVRECEALAREGAFAEVARRLEGVAFGLRELDDEVRRRREEAVRRRDEAATAADRDRSHDAAALDEAVPRIMQLARARDFAGALRAAEELYDGVRTLDGKSEAQRYKSWIGAAGKLAQGAKDGMERLKPGDKVAFELRRGEKVEGTVYAASGGAVIVGGSKERTVSMGDLSVESVVWLYERPLDGRSTPADRRAAALLAIVEGDAAAAERYMEIVTKAGWEVPQQVQRDYRALVEGDASRRAEEEKRRKRERDAEAALVEAERLAAARKLDEALAKLDAFLKEFGDTAFRRKAEDRIRKLQAVGPREIVIYAADARGELPREWRLLDDASAAEGKCLMSAAERSWRESPTGAPFVDFKFVAAKDVKYRVWTRLRCGSNRAMQNAIAVQLSEALDGEGREIAPLGSGRSVVLQLWAGENRTPERGWTGHDQYREQTPRAAAEYQFSYKTTGEKTLRVLVNEGGTGFDQIVISAEKFVEAAPAADVVPRPKK